MVGRFDSVTREDGLAAGWCEKERSAVSYLGGLLETSLHSASPADLIDATELLLRRFLRGSFLREFRLYRVWCGCERVNIEMDISPYKEYVFELLLVKVVLDTHVGRPGA